MKNKTININGFEVPEPLRKIDRNGDIVHVVSLEKTYVVTCVTRGINDLIDLGIVHKTLACAEIHRTALLSFTKAKK
jgi:hypothetical protein